MRIDVFYLALSLAATLAAGEAVRVPASARNLLVAAKVSGNLEDYKLGMRGRADHMIYDVQAGRFVKQAQWHEYGVGFGKDLGVVPEAKPAWWMAQWPKPVQANLIALSGVYPNQPQPETRWKIELRQEGQWTTHARGKGGWYDRGRYVWGGHGTEAKTFDALRVSVFSKDATTPIKSIHFRGEKGLSWVVARLLPFDARIRLPRGPIRAGQPVTLTAETVAGTIRTWAWDLGDGKERLAPKVTHRFTNPGEQTIKLTFSDGKQTASVQKTLMVLPPVAARIAPLMGPVMAGKPVELDGFDACGKATTFAWDFADGSTADRARVRHTFAKPGIYRLTLTVSDGRYRDACPMILRVHTPETVHVPQVFLDTDQKNEVDDQHYFGYGLFGELDVLGVNSIHHGGGQEPVNYRELVHIRDLAKQSGLPEARVPAIYRGANQRLRVPDSGRWEDTEPIVTDASTAILAAARGASPANPVWVVPVGPGTNAASALLQARAEGLKLKDRLRVMWLGGSNQAITGEFNGNNDPWSLYVVAQSGVETWIMPAPVGGRIRMDVRKEADLYADNPLGRYLEKIVPRRNKAIFDPSCLAAIVSLRLGLGWIKQAEPVTIAGPDKGYRWTKTDQPTAVRVIRQIDQEAMKRDLFDTLKGKPTRLIGVPPGP